MQSKIDSFRETLVQTLVGYLLSFVVQLVVFPLYGASFTLWQNMQIGLIFLIVSVARGYIIRRFYNRSQS